jgi:hypothetical protein
MTMKTSRLLAGIAIVSAFAISAQAQSLGDQARNLRTEKPETPQSKVFTNDNLPTSGGITVVGAPAPAASAAPASTASSTATKATATSTAGTAPAAEDPSKTADKIKGDVEKQKAEISRLERELDVSTREWKLRQASYYGDAGNQLRDPKAWAEQERKYNDETSQKQQALSDAKQKLDDLQEQARKAGLSSSAVE